MLLIQRCQYESAQEEKEKRLFIQGLIDLEDLHHIAMILLFFKKLLKRVQK